MKSFSEACSSFTNAYFAGHPHFFNQLYAGFDAYGFAGQIVTDALNTSM